ncbi:MAG: AAA family ATPase [Sellimonas intestinalis]
MLVGPPGTGKDACWQRQWQARRRYRSSPVSGSAFVEMYVGVGASRVRDLFKQAQQMAPCIIFIDEIDAIAQSRDNQHQEATMRGADSEPACWQRWMDLRATKALCFWRPPTALKILDPALLRPGRF